VDVEYSDETLSFVFAARPDVVETVRRKSESVQPSGQSPG
jgi:hypothetical protein